MFNYYELVKINNKFKYRIIQKWICGIFFGAILKYYSICGKYVVKIKVFFEN